MIAANRVGEAIAWGLIAILSVGVAGYALFLTATGFKYLHLQNGFFTPLGLQTHIAASGVALLMGPFQFLKGLRARQPRLHRWMGRIYVAACLIGGVAGGAIALYSSAGLPAGFGFLALAVLWLISTSAAWRAALRRDFISHERWMIRSFALTFAAVTLRIYLPIAIIQSQGDFPIHAYQIIAWACWVPNLIIAELWIRARTRKPRTPTPSAVLS